MRSPSLINRNMGCIETKMSALPSQTWYWINRNMGCIETFIMEYYGSGVGQD